ncbi:sodium bile acid symporter family protein [Apiospora sp. TS-2023a]
MHHEKKCASSDETQIPTISSRLWGLIKDQWFLIVFVVLVLLSSQVQGPGAQQGLTTRIVQNLTIAVIFFINGLATQTRDLMAKIWHWRCRIFIQVMGFFFTSRCSGSSWR